MLAALLPRKPPLLRHTVDPRCETFARALAAAEESARHGLQAVWVGSPDESLCTSMSVLS